MEKTKYLIGDVANLMGLSRDTLRYYEKRGILSSKRGDNGYRYYTDQDISRLISILYQRKMDIGLSDMENLWSADNSIDNLTGIIDSRLKEEEKNIRQHQQNIARLKLTRSDCEDIRHNLDQVSLRKFPAARIIVPHTSIPESVSLWFEYSRKYSGLDMMYTFNEYFWTESADTLQIEYQNTQLLLFEELKDYVDYPFDEQVTESTRQVPCISVCCTSASEFPTMETIRSMISWAKEKGLSLSHRLYSTFSTHGRRDGLDTYFLRVYIPAA